MLDAFSPSQCMQNMEALVCFTFVTIEPLHMTVQHGYCFIYQLQTVRGTGLSCLSIDWMVLTFTALIACNNQMHRYDCTFPVKNWTRERCYCQPPPHSCSLVKDKVVTKAFGTVYVQTPVTTPWKGGISVTQVHSGNSPVCSSWSFSFLFFQLRSMGGIFFVGCHPCLLCEISTW